MVAVAVDAQEAVREAELALVHREESAVVQVAAADVAAAQPVHSDVQAAHHVVVRSRNVRSVMSTKSYAHQT